MSPVFQISALLLAGACLVLGADWNYEGEDHWPAKCHSGQHQSPVDLNSYQCVSANYEKLAFISYDDKTSMHLVNNGHTVQFDLVSPKRTVLASGGLPSVYYLAQMHFHWDSEHTVHGRRFPLELHLVHYDRNYASIGEAMTEEEGLAVVGIIFQYSSENNTNLEPILEALEKIDGRVDEQHPVEITPEGLFPEDINQFYRYRGSLTTPGCDETVVWTVLANYVPIHESQVNRFKAIRGKHGKIGHNYRAVKGLNGRSVSLTLMAGSGASAIVPISSLLVLLSCCYAKFVL